METQQIKRQPLRICRYCGLEAYTTEDLELFTRDNQRLYGRNTLCKICRNKYQKKWQKDNPEKVKATHMRGSPRRIYFQGKRIYLKENPRTNICSKCGKSYPGELKCQTAMHHEFYNSDDVLTGTVELCQSCHAKLHYSKEKFKQ